MARLDTYKLTPQGESVVLNMERPDYPVEWSFTNGQRVLMDLLYDVHYLSGDASPERWTSMFSNPERIPKGAMFHVVNALRGKGLLERSAPGRL